MNNLKQMAKRILATGLPVPGAVRPLIRLLYNGGVIAVEALTFVKKLIWIEPVVRSVCKTVGSGFMADCLPYMRGEGDIYLGDKVYLSGRSCFYFMHGMGTRPEIRIGSRVFIGNMSTLSCGKRITIGDDCLISADVRIHDNDGHPKSPAKRRAHEPISPDDVADVVIGNNVWIGAGAVILKGVTIGDDSIIGAGAVVTRSVASGVIATGNPAQVVGNLKQEL